LAFGAARDDRKGVFAPKAGIGLTSKIGQGTSGPPHKLGAGGTLGPGGLGLRSGTGGGIWPAAEGQFPFVRVAAGCPHSLGPLIGNGAGSAAWRPPNGAAWSSSFRGGPGGGVGVTVPTLGSDRRLSGQRLMCNPGGPSGIHRHGGQHNSHGGGGRKPSGPGQPSKSGKSNSNPRLAASEGMGTLCRLGSFIFPRCRTF